MPSFDSKALEAALDHLEANSEYGRGVADTLQLLGLYHPTGKITGLVLDSLRAHLQDGVKVDQVWERQPGAGLELLRAIESVRVAAVANPSPARKVWAVQAIIKRRLAGIDHYLMEYDRQAGQYQLIGGKVDSKDPDPETALRREIAEELGLDHMPGAETCRVQLIKVGWETSALSMTYGIFTQYRFDFYHVHMEAIPTAQARWVSVQEMETGSTEGQKISSVALEGLGRAILDQLAC